MKIRLRKIKFSELVKFIIAINIILIGLGATTTVIFQIPNIDYIAFFVMIIVTVYLILSRKVYKTAVIRFKYAPYMQFCVAWFVFGVVSVLINHNDWNIRQPIYLSSLIAISISCVIYATCIDLRTFRFYCNAFLISTLINYIISANELIVGNHITEPRGYFQSISTYVGFSNQNNYATFLIYSTIIAYILVKFTEKNNKKYKYFFGFVFIMDFLLSIATGSITGITAHLLITAVFLLKHFINVKGTSVFAVSTIIIFAYLLFVIVIIAATPSWKIIRIIYLNNVVPMFRKSFIFGLGPGGNVIFNNGWVHNLSFELLFDYGILVFIFYIYMLVKIIGFYNKYNCFELVFSFLLMPIIWISSSSALSLHFTWSFMTLIAIFPMLYRKKSGDIICL